MSQLTEEEIIRFKDNHKSDRLLVEICNLACLTFRQKTLLEAAIKERDEEATGKKQAGELMNRAVEITERAKELVVDQAKLMDRHTEEIRQLKQVSRNLSSENLDLAIKLASAEEELTKPKWFPISEAEIGKEYLVWYGGSWRKGTIGKSEDGLNAWTKMGIIVPVYCANIPPDPPLNLGPGPA